MAARNEWTVTRCENQKEVLEFLNETSNIIKFSVCYMHGYYEVWCNRIVDYYD